SLNSITKMASSAAPVDNAAAAVAVAYSTFESLRLGKTAQAVVGRLIRFWDSRNINKNGEFMGITILLLDELVRIISNLFLLFLVELAVDDGKDSATFVVFDKEMTKLTKQEAAVLALDENSNGGEDYLPSCLEGLTGKEFVFQIRVMPFNFTPNHRTFTVSTITEDNTMANHSKIV
ncbi:hypothetical protein HID58_077860, partial [Brassica napus]